MAEQIGWISVHRKIQECDIWIDDEPFDRRSAWIDLLLMANHRDKNAIIGYEPITIKAGQRLTSIRKLSARWHWGNEKTLNYLRMLESLGMIERDSSNGRTLITIVNYEVYQNCANTFRTETERKQNGDRTEAERRPSTNNNDNNENNDNKSNRAMFLPPTLEKVKAYIQEIGLSVDAQRFVDFYESKGWMVGKNKMKDWKACIRTWESKDKPNPKAFTAIDKNDYKSEKGIEELLGLG